MRAGWWLAVASAGFVGLGGRRTMAQEVPDAAPAPAEVEAAEAEDEGTALDVTLDVPILSGYLWRGQVYNDEPVLQPSLSVSKGGFYLSVWSDMDLTDRNDHAGDFSEVDFVASYTREFKWVGLELGLAEYLYPHQTLETEAEAEEGEGAEAEGAERRTTGEAYPGTREVYLNTTLTFGEFPIAPALSLNYDFDEADGFYGAAGLTYNQEFLNERLQVEASVTVGWGSKKYNAYYFEVEDGAFNDCTVSLGAGYELSDRWTVTPSLQYGVLLDGDLRTAAKEGDLGHAELLVGSLNVSYTF